VSLVGTTGLAGATKVHVPTVRSVSPDHGSVNGGTTVTITGRYLVGATSVSFGGTPAVSFTPKSNNAILAQSPSGTAGTVDITVTTSLGTSAVVVADEFTYVTTPAIQSISPRIGSSTGGNRVTIAGSDFTGVTGVSFGGTPAASFVIDSAQAITAISPPEAAGIVDVTVTGPDGTSPIDPGDRYSFALRVPKVTSVVPDVGPVGTSVTITGTGFAKVSAVSFGSTPAAGFVVDMKAKTITVLSPPGSGVVDITVTAAKGTSIVVPMDVYTYTG